jgi:type IV secretion system protein VirD4
MARAGDFLNQFLFAVVVVFNRIRSFFQQSQSLHTARFAAIHELSGLLTPSLDAPSTDGLLLGISHFNRVLSVRPTKTRRELGNTLVVAPPRSGKSVLATSQLLSWHHSVVVNDVKGELFAATAGYRASLGKVFVIDPTGIGNRYDPLTGKHTEDELLSAATHLLYQPDEGEGKIFSQRATGMLTQLFIAAREEGYPPLPYVRHMIRTGLPHAAERLHAINPDLATQFLDVPYSEANFSDRFLLSGWGTLTARLRPLLTETVIRSLAGNDFSARDLMTSAVPITLYLRWTERDLLALSPLLRLMWSSLIDELITTYDQSLGKNCKPVLLLIDEAGRTAIPSLADHATTVVGRGISLWLSIQSLSQLDAVYGTARAQIIKDDMDSQLFYKPSDQKTAEYIARALGDKSGFAHSETKHETHSSEGTSEQRIPVLTAWAIKHLTKRTEIFGFYNSDEELPPFKATRMDWRRFPILVTRQAIPPPELSPLPLLDLQLPLLGQAVTTFPTGFIDPDQLLDPDSLQEN